VCGAVGEYAHMVNGTYELVQLPMTLANCNGNDMNEEPPTFQKRGDSGKWLFCTNVNTWWVGPEEAKSGLSESGFGHSWVVSAGTLPQAAGDWKVFQAGSVLHRGDSPWATQDLHLAARPLSDVYEAEAAAWQAAWHEARSWAAGQPAVEISGVAGLNALAVNGRYVLVTAPNVHLDTRVPVEAFGGGAVGPAVAAADPMACPPVFRKQENPDTWLYLSSSSAWWVGSTQSKDARASRGLAHSLPVQPGTLPPSATGWRYSGGRPGSFSGEGLRPLIVTEVFGDSGGFFSNFMAIACCGRMRRQIVISAWDSKVVQWEHEDRKGYAVQPW